MLLDEDGSINDEGKRMMTIREVFLTAFHPCFNETPPIRDMFARGGKLKLVCESYHLSQAAKFAVSCLQIIQDEIGHIAFAKACGCNHPEDSDKHARVSAVTGYGKVGLWSISIRPGYKSEMEKEINDVAQAPGIIDEKNNTPLTATDLTKPPATSHRATGREPIENDPKHLREGAAEIWKKFADDHIPATRSTTTKKTVIASTPTAVMPNQPPNEETRNDISALQTAMKEMKESQQNQETSAASLSNTVKILETSMTTMAEAITMNNASLTDMNGKFDALNRQLASLTEIITQPILQKNSNKDDESVEDITDTIMTGGDGSPRPEAVKHTRDGNDVISYPNILHDSTQHAVNLRSGRDPPTFPSITASPGLSYSPHSSQNPNAGQSSSSRGFEAGV